LEASAQLAGALDDAVDLAGKCSIRETMGLLAGLRLTAGSDTGVMHLAAGVGCPTLTVFGPNPASKWGHLYPPHRVIEACGGDIKTVSAADLVGAADSALRG
jgi:ADP-heptose:LPS heptosyltransferase